MSEDNLLDTTIDEWRKEIEQVCYPHDSGLTAKELQNELNIGRWAVDKFLSQMLREGKCVRGKGVRINSIGRRHVVTVYQLKKDIK